MNTEEARRAFEEMRKKRAEERKCGGCGKAKTLNQDILDLMDKYKRPVKK